MNPPSFDPAARATARLQSLVEATLCLMEQLHVQKRACESESDVSIYVDAEQQIGTGRFWPASVKFDKPDGDVTDWTDPKIRLNPEDAIMIQSKPPEEPNLVAFKKRIVSCRSVMVHELTHYFQAMSKKEWEETQTKAIDFTSEKFNPYKYVRQKIEVEAFGVKGAYYFTNLDSGVSPSDYDLSEWRDRIICKVDEGMAQRAKIKCPDSL